MQSVIKKLPTNKSPGSVASQGDSVKHLKVNTQSQTIPKKSEEEETIPNSFNEASITLIPKSDKDTTKKKITGQFLMNINVKILKILVNQIKQDIKRIIYHD